MPAKKTVRKSVKKVGKLPSDTRRPTSPFPNPREVKKFVTEAGEKMTKVDFGPPFQKALVDSADRLMSDARNTPGILNLSLIWHFILPWLENSQAEKDRFWQTFNQPAAEKQRKAGLWGVKYTNYSKERVVLGLVEEFKALTGLPSEQDGVATVPLFRDINPDSEQKKALIDEMLKNLGGWVIESVLSDHEAPRRLHALLKHSNTVESQAGNLARKILEKFAMLLAAEWKLPTKKRLRLKAGFGNTDEGKSAASREFRKLGLAGLPEG